MDNEDEPFELEGGENIEVAEVEEAVNHDPKYTCEICDWKPASFCKDADRALKNHYKSKHTEYYKDNFNTRKSKKKQPEKITIIENVSNIVDEVKTSNPDITEEEERQMILQDLDMFKLKFKDLEYEFKYNNDSSLEFLKREKGLFLRMIQDEVGTKAIFNLICVAGKSAERITDSLGVVDINGYSKDLKDNEVEIVTILKDMVDSGLISAKALTPEIRLLLVCGSLAINRAEINKIEKKKQPVDI